MVHRWAAALLLLAAAAPAAAQTYSSGSTTFSWIDASSHSKVGHNTTPYKFVAASGCGTAPPVLDDTLAGPIPIGFTFRFGTTDYTSLYVMSNGRLQFGNVTCGAGTNSIGPPQTYPYGYPNGQMNATMKVFGVDLDHTNLVDKPNYPSASSKTPCTSTSSCYVAVATLGTAPSRQFVVTWKNVPEWVSASNTSGSFDLQVILNEDGSFVYQYGVISHGGTGTAQIGWQLTSSDYQVLSFGAATEPAPNSAIKFYLPKPIASYYMDEAAWAAGVSGQVPDSSGSRAGSTLGAVSSVAGKLCRAASIPANTGSAVDAIKTGVRVADSALNLQGAGTLAFWYRSNAAWSGAGATDAQLLDASGPSGEWFYLNKKASGQLYFVIKDSTGSVRTVNTSALSIAANTWTHIAVSWDFNGAAGSNRDKLQIIVNGGTATSSAFTSSGTVSTATDYLHLGDNPLGVADTNGSLNSANGQIDEINIYNYVLTSAQVTTLMAATRSCASYTLDHLEIQYSGSNGLTCAPSTVTIRACQNASCSTLYTSGISGTLTASGTTSVTWDSSSGNAAGAGFTIPNGSSSVTKRFQGSTAGHVDLGLSGLSPSPTGTNSCNFGSPSCRINVVNVGFAFDVPDHVAETGQTVSISSLSSAGGSCAAALANTTRTVRFTCSYDDPGNGTLPIRVGGKALNSGNSSGAKCDGTGQALSLAFNASGVATAALQYADVGRVTLNASYTGSSGTGDAGVTMNGSDSFVAAPASFGVALVTATPIKAGSPFSTSYTALNSAGATTPNFGLESGAKTLLQTKSHAQPTGFGYSVGTINDGSLSSFSGGTATATGMSWTEVGRINLGMTLSNYLGSGLGATGSASAVGPFIPHHFKVDVLSPSCATSFTYSGQPIDQVKITALNQAGLPTVNYDGVGGASGMSPSFAKAFVLSDANTASPLAGTLSPAGFAASYFASGVATLNKAVTFTFTTKLTAAGLLSLRAIDADGVSSAGFAEGSTSERSGRLRLSNAFGSKSSPLGLAVETQYWTGKAWAKNAQDSCTSIPAAAIALFNKQRGDPPPPPPLPTPNPDTVLNNTVSAAVAITGGAGTLTLSAATPAAAGSLDLAINLGTGSSMDKACSSATRSATTGAGLPWLRSQYGSAGGCGTAWDRDPSARASFGIFSPETRKSIHAREIF